MSLIAYSIAGEKMPWLTFYIVMPVLLAARLGSGLLDRDHPVEKNWQITRVLFAVLLVPVFLGQPVCGLLAFYLGRISHLRA